MRPPGGGAWDAVVVGGGPAGAAFAARLARLGHAVLLLDRARFPRRKPCGECLSPAAVAELDALGVLAAVRAAGPAPLRGWRIRAGDAAFVGDFPAGLHGLALPRATLDALLLEHARACGAEVRTGWRVADLLRCGARVGGVRAAGPDGAREELAARLTVGADGLRSVVLRRLGLLRRGPRLRKVALTAHVRGLDGPAAERRGELRVGAGGCVGIADVGDGSANVTVVVEGAGIPELSGDVPGCFDRALARLGPARAERLDEVLTTGPFDWPIRSAVAPGALLVGDAAGYYDPFTGQGIFRALRGAALAAEAAAAALRADDLSAAALAPYERARRRAFGPGERVQRVVEAFVSRPPLLRAAARRFAARPALGDAVVAVTGDLRPVRSLLDPRLLAQLVV